MARRVLVSVGGVASAVGLNSCFGKEREAPIVVVGGGVMGASACYSISSKGVPCVLIDDGDPFKSSWGESRVARDVQQEAIYVRLFRRSLGLWKKIEEEAEQEVMVQTGIITLGEGEKLEKAKENNRLLDLEFETLNAESFPQVNIPESTEGIYQSGGWVVLASKAVDALYNLSPMKGGTVIENDGVTKINRKEKWVETESGHRVHYSKLVLSCGPKTNKVLQGAGLSSLAIVPTAEQQNYYKPRDSSVDHSTASMPVIIEFNERFIYVVPHVVDGVEGVKVSLHGAGEVMQDSEYVIPAGVDATQLYPYRSVHTSRNVVTTGLPSGRMPSTAIVNEWVKTYLPHLHPEPHYTYRCVYTSSVKGDGPVLGPHPDDSDVIMCCAFSGEGFKFAPVYGEIAGNYALNTPQEVQGLQRFLPDRLVV